MRYTLRWPGTPQELSWAVGEVGGSVSSPIPSGGWLVELPDPQACMRLHRQFPGCHAMPEAMLRPPARPLRLPSAPGQGEMIVRVYGAGAPVEGATVEIVGASALAWRGRTDAGGEVILPIGEGSLKSVTVLTSGAWWPHHQALSGPLPEGPLLIELMAVSPFTEGYDWGHERGIKVRDAHARGLTGRGVRVGIVDTGVAPHPDLRLVGGFNSADQEPTLAWGDSHWHGTHVAGIVAGQPNSAGVVGVAPGVELVGVRVGRVDTLGSLSFTNALFETDLLEALRWCLDQGLDVINMSLFAPETPALVAILEEAWQKGTIVVAPTGNRNLAGDARVGEGVDFPARHPRVLGVGALGRVGTYPAESWFTQAEVGAHFSPTWPDWYVPGFSRTGAGLDFVAPGVAVLSTIPAGLAGRAPTAQPLLGYTTWMGTSQAAPFVTGLVALILEGRPDIRALPGPARWAAVREALVASCVSLGLDPLYQGHGLPMATAIGGPSHP